MVQPKKCPKIFTVSRPKGVRHKYFLTLEKTASCPGFSGVYEESKSFAFDSEKGVRVKKCLTPF
jgi:hypothetical protein